MRGKPNTLSFGHTRLLEWADRHDSLGYAAVSTVGRMFEEGAGAACQAGGRHGDPTAASQLREADKQVHRCQKAVDALREHDEDTWAAVMAHYLHGLEPGRIASGLGVEPRRGRELLECGQAWVGSRVDQLEAREKGESKAAATGTDG